MQSAGLLKHIGRIEETSAELVDERTLRVAAEQQVQRLQRDVQNLQLELERYRRLTNSHTKATLSEAIELFKKFYPEGHAETTVRRVFAAIDEFAVSVDGSQNIGKIAALQIDTWLRNRKSQVDSKNEVSPATRQRLKAYISSFWNWASREEFARYRYFPLSSHSSAFICELNRPAPTHAPRIS